MIILGLDPGYATTGVGLIDFSGSKLTYIHHEAIITKSKTPFPDRLHAISKQLDDIITFYKPESVAIESLFFSNNAKTAIDVAQARGVMVLTSKQHNKSVYDYTPPQVKSGVCGYGNADKKQVQYMVKQLLNLKKTPKPDDAADALAIAICHAHSAKMNAL